ncbi:putative ribonuclease H-like domain-containing protein, partial [Tanacetum coccineum]
LKFNSIKDAKKLLEAVEKRFGGNEATKKTQRNLLKQQYKNFTALSSEMLDQTFDRLQKLVSQLELLDEKLSQEDVNQKLLRSLSPEWNTHVVVWRNKADLDTMSMDDLYNNLKVYEPEVKGMSSSSSSTQNMAFVSSSNNNTSSTNEAVNTAHGVSTASTQVNAATPTNIVKLEEVVYLLQGIKNNKNKKAQKECACGTSTSTPLSQVMVLVDKDWKVYNDSICSKSCLKTIESLKSQNDQLLKDLKKSELMVLGYKTGEIAIRELRKKLEIVQKEKDGIQLNVDKFEHASKSLNKLIEYQIVDNYKKAFSLKNCKAMSSEEEPKVVRKTDDALIIEEYVSDDEEEDVSQPKTEKKTVRPSIVKKEFVKSKQQEKTARKTVKQTSGILKSFITGIENLVDHKVKVIRCDNRTEFKNKEMNQFCEMKGILRQFSVARTPQQNRVAKRRNRTLIEVPRTMIADSKLSTTFWVEAVNTACYCPVTILNTIDHLGKFDGKADEGFFIGYSLNSKAFRVFNGTQSSVTGTPVKNCILLPLWTADLPYSQDPKSSHDDGSKPSSDDGKKVDEDPRKDSECKDQEKEDNVNSTNTVNAAGTNEVNAVGGKTSIELPFDPNMSALKDYSIFDYSSNDKDDGAEDDMNNLDTTIQVNPILTTRIHKDHPLDQVIGNLQSATQTRKMSKNLEEHGKNPKRIEAIRLFLAYASFKDFVVYQMDVKSVFLYGKIEEEVYVCQPPRFEDPDFPDIVYKVKKALYGLHQAPRA